jgi:hypothetical protein
VISDKSITPYGATDYTVYASSYSITPNGHSNKLHRLGLDIRNQDKSQVLISKCQFSSACRGLVITSQTNTISAWPCVCWNALYKYFPIARLSS